LKFPAREPIGREGCLLRTMDVFFERSAIAPLLA
jgi:hypothetical protein